MTDKEKKQLEKWALADMEYYTQLLRHLAPCCPWDFTLNSYSLSVGLDIKLSPSVDYSRQQIDYRLRIIRQNEPETKKRIGLVFEYRDRRTERRAELWTTDWRPWGLGQFPNLTEDWQVKNSAFVSTDHKKDAGIISEVIEGLTRLCTLGMLQPINELRQ